MRYRSQRSERGEAGETHLLRWFGRPRPTKVIEPTQYRWVALRIGGSGPTGAAEFTAADHLDSLGLQSYCPIAVRRVLWLPGRIRAPKNTYRADPVFRRYIFAGLTHGQSVRRDTRWRIEGALSSASGPITVPPQAISELMALESQGLWNESLSWRDRLAVKVGDRVRFALGPFAECCAVVTAIETEVVIRLLVDLFGRPTIVHADIGQVMRVAV